MELRDTLVRMKGDIISLIEDYSLYMNPTDVEEINYILDMINYCLFEPQDMERLKLTYIELDGYRDDITVNHKVKPEYTDKINNIFKNLISIMNSLGIDEYYIW